MTKEEFMKKDLLSRVEYIEEFVRDVVDMWDIDTLLDFAMEELYQKYSNDIDGFIEEYNEFYGSME